MRATSIIVTAVAVVLVAFSGSSHAEGHNPIERCAATEPVRFPGTIVEAALATPDLSTLAFAVQAAGLVDALNSPGPFVVFAPVNDAFAAIPDSILSAILADVDILAAVLTYHVIAGIPELSRSRGFSPIELDTLQGQSVFLNRSADALQVNQSNINCQAVITDNGVVLIVDSVLLPQF